MQALALQDITPIVHRARLALAQAETAAEVLDVKERAGFVYDAAKRAARLARVKGAADEAIAAAYRLQADALDLEAAAKCRLADEYDAAQARGEVGQSGARTDLVPNGNEVVPTAADLGLSRKEIYDARQVRDAEIEDPGFVRRVLDEALDRGEAPTRAVLAREIEARKNPRVVHNSGNNEWYTPTDILEAARYVLRGFDLDPASSEIANRLVRAAKFFTAEDDGLAQEWPVGRIWMNPPYVQPLVAKFSSRFAAEVRRGSTGIVLVNNATETGWFQEIAAGAAAICFPKGRVRFLDPEGNPSGAPLQGQAVIYCGGKAAAFRETFSNFGLVR